jgi:hypothetical protein
MPRPYTKTGIPKADAMTYPLRRMTPSSAAGNIRAPSAAPAVRHAPRRPVSHPASSCTPRGLPRPYIRITDDHRLTRLRYFNAYGAGGGFDLIAETRSGMCD